jgi:hypothetical protein
VIVKLQISLNDGGATALVYNERKSFIQQLPATDDVLTLMGSRVKAFFRVRFSKDRHVVLEEEVEDQDW